VQFTVDPLPGESLRGCQAIVAQSLSPDRSGVFSFAIFIAVAFIAFLWIPSTAPQTVLLSIGGTVALIVALQAYARRRLRKLAMSDKHALESYFIALDDHGARTWCEHVDARYAWAEFSYVSENSEFFLLVRGGGAGIAIPKRVVPDEEALRLQLGGWLPGPATPSAAGDRQAF
jgi:hypothetical protein